MNKRKRVAMMKHRQKRKRYEALRKTALLAGTISSQSRQRTTPRLVETPLEEVAARTPRRSRRTARAQDQETTVAQVSTAEAAGTRRGRRTKAAEATAEEKPKRTRRTTTAAEDDKPAEDKPKRTRRTTKKTDEGE